MRWRFATTDDAQLLAELNHQLIADEGHSNAMTRVQLEQRMHSWLSGEYRAVLFSIDADVISYALFRNDEQARVHLRQFFVHRGHRRQGIGREALQLLRTSVVPDQRVMIEVLVTNESARAFWTATGFVEYAITMEHTPNI